MDGKICAFCIRMVKTRKRREPTKTKIVEVFLGILNAVKLYHWNTFSFAKHKATDELYSRLNEHIDKFVEVMMGKKGRIPEYSKKITATSSDFKRQVHNYREFLIHLGDLLDDERDTDLLNIRDEILADVNQFLYLLTLTK